MRLRHVVRLCAMASFAWCLLGASGEARAQSIEDARQAWFDADFEASRDEFLAVLASRTLTPAQALDAHRFLAVIHLALGHDADAAAHAEAAVALDPSARPPEGAPRGADDLFLMARRRLGDRRAELTIEPRERVAPSVPVTVVARLEPAPAALASSIRLQCGAAERRGAAPSVELEVVPRADLTCSAEARTEAGAVLLSVERPLANARDTDARGARTPSSEHRRKVWPIVVGGSIAVAAVVGVVVGLVVHNHSQDASFGGTTVVGW